MVSTTTKFREQNPKVYGAVLKAINEANAIIAADNKSAAELLRVQVVRQHPFGAVSNQQVLLPRRQRVLPPVVGRQSRSLDLHADELGPGRRGVGALFVEPVGEDESGGVVVRVGPDALEEGFGVGVHAAPDRNPSTRPPLAALRGVTPATPQAAVYSELPLD